VASHEVLPIISARKLVSHPIDMVSLRQPISQPPMNSGEGVENAAERTRRR
jgi:hypothetical protein